MFNQNYLIRRLRVASVGFENTTFLDNIETELTELAESKGAAKKKQSQMKLF